MFREIREIKPDETRKAHMSDRELFRRIQPKKEMTVDELNNEVINIFKRIKVEEEAQK